MLREAKDLNNNRRVDLGQIGLSYSIWPFIQLYDLNPTGNVKIQYNKGGGVQSTTLTFDTVDQFAGLELDRSTYPLGAQVHATVTDAWLNIDPTDEDSWTFGTQRGGTTHYQVFDENGKTTGDSVINLGSSLTTKLSDLMCSDCKLFTNHMGQGAADNIIFTLQNNSDSGVHFTTGSMADPSKYELRSSTGTGHAAALSLGAGTVPVTITEQGPNTGVFATYDESDVSVIKITETADRDTSGTIDYNDDTQSIVVGHVTGKVEIRPVDATWNSGEEIPVVIIDGDANKNTRADEDLVVSDGDVTAIPSLRTGDPFTLDEGEGSRLSEFWAIGSDPKHAIKGHIDVETFSKRGTISFANASGSMGDVRAIVFNSAVTAEELKAKVPNTHYANGTKHGNIHGFSLLNVDFRSLDDTAKYTVRILPPVTKVIDSNDDHLYYGSSATYGTSGLAIASDIDAQSLTVLPGATVGKIHQLTGKLWFAVNSTSTFEIKQGDKKPIVLDVFSFGFKNDGVKASDRFANQIVRIEAEESGDNTGIFEGTLEYVMLNQLNILEEGTYTGLSTIDDEASFIVMEDLTDEDAPRVTYYDKDAQGVDTQTSDQEEAPSHSGVVSFDSDSYKIADTVKVTVEDFDLNTDSSTRETYTVFTGAGDKKDAVASEKSVGILMDITFDDTRWTSTAGTCATSLGNSEIHSNLAETKFSLTETEAASGIFVGTFQIPAQWCDGNSVETTTGKDIEVNYHDFRDASGEIIEVGDSAGIRANTGSVSLDRTVYPVPFGVPTDFTNANGQNATDRSIFQIHDTGVTGDAESDGEFIPDGDLTVHIRVNDPDFDVSATGEDMLGQNVTDANKNATPLGPVKISVIRGSDAVVLAYAGNDKASPGYIDAEKGEGHDRYVPSIVRQMGPISEIAPDAGIFELDFAIRYTDGPISSDCPETRSWVATNGTDGSKHDQAFRFDSDGRDGNYCILQGDILQVEYTDPADASGNPNTVTDSATFDLRNGVLQSDKSAYIIGSDMILTLIEPDLDLDNDAAETYSLDLIEWDSDAGDVSMGKLGGEANTFDPEPRDLRETGDSTGIFQVVVEIPEKLGNNLLERGEEIVLEYTDEGPSGSDYVGEEDEDVNLTVYTSNFGATVELDQKVYTWTDKVYITIVAPDHNFDGDLVDEIGNTDKDPIKVSTRGSDIGQYKLVETGTDTGIFTGEVILTGFKHDADGDGEDDLANGDPDGKGPTDGKLPSEHDDGLTISFEFSEDETIVGSALIRWNIGEVQWLEASYPASGTGVIRVIDPDMNLNPEAVDNFDVDVWSDSDAGGVDLTVTETNEATGIFEGTVFFTTTDESSGHRLRVAEGDTVTAEYEDHTLPKPDSTADERSITATSLIGTIVPPLERVPATNLRIVDAFGNSLDTVSVDQQVQISADIANGQDRDQPFAYLVQVQDADGVTVELDWIASTLAPGQASSQASSWTPAAAGAYTITAFVWESTDNPTALSPPVEITVNVN